jgi:phosphoadenosine phosphosulfate reductase
VSTISWDTRYGLVKVAPLAHWSAERVREHLRAHDLPQNELLTRGYPSIGCVPCTRPSTDERGGRWADLDKTECGIHLPLAGVSA